MNCFLFVLEILAASSPYTGCRPAPVVICRPAPVICRPDYRLLEQPRWPAPFVALPTPPLPGITDEIALAGTDLARAWQGWASREEDREFYYWLSQYPDACGIDQQEARGYIQRRIGCYVHSVSPGFD